jgi:hypothetical protein
MPLHDNDVPPRPDPLLNGGGAPDPSGSAPTNSSASGLGGPSVPGK